MHEAFLSFRAGHVATTWHFYQPRIFAGMQECTTTRQQQQQAVHYNARGNLVGHGSNAACLSSFRSEWSPEQAWNCRGNGAAAPFPHIHTARARDISQCHLLYLARYALGWVPSNRVPSGFLKIGRSSGA